MANKEHIREWIHALESGEYKQGFGWLREDQDNTSYYCCLGVACNVAGFEWKYDAMDGRYAIELNGYLETTDPPVKLGEWLDFNSEDYYFKTNYPKHLAVLNDSGEYTFEDIAQLLRDRYDIRD